MDQITFQRHLKQLVGLILVGVLAWIAFEVYVSTIFHVVKTNPSVSSVTTITPFLDIDFSQMLANDHLTISSTGNVVSAYKISGKIIRLSLNSPMAASQRYNIVIASVRSSSGKQMSNLHFAFTPILTDYNKLPSDQQKTLIQQQSQAENNQPPSYLGTDALISNGASAEQVQDFEQAVESFAKSVSVPVKSVVIDTNSVTTPPPNPDNLPPTLDISFSVSLNSTDYRAVLKCSGITTAELLLFDAQTGGQLFDSGVISN